LKNHHHFPAVISELQFDFIPSLFQLPIQVIHAGDAPLVKRPSASPQMGIAFKADPILLFGGLVVSEDIDGHRKWILMPTSPFFHF
jgi:hypothetical protein